MCMNCHSYKHSNILINNRPRCERIRYTCIYTVDCIGIQTVLATIYSNERIGQALRARLLALPDSFIASIRTCICTVNKFEYLYARTYLKASIDSVD